LTRWAGTVIIRLEVYTMRKYLSIEGFSINERQGTRPRRAIVLVSSMNLTATCWFSLHFRLAKGGGAGRSDRRRLRRVGAVDCQT
jgi:hypothetical protein